MMPSGSKKITPAFLLLFIVTLTGFFYLPPEAGAREESLVIGLLPEMNVFKQRQRFKPLAYYLSEQMGIEVRLTIMSSYSKINEKIGTGEVDGAFLGSFTAAMAISQLGAIPLARPINMDGTSTYYGQIFVRKDNSIKTVSDMKGKSLALVERTTTAGYIFPLAWLKRQGINDFRTYFSDYFFTGSHDAAIDAVLNNKADVGSAKNTIYEQMRELNPRIDNELVVLASSPRVPSNGLCMRANLAPQYIEQFKTLLLNLHNDQKGVEVLKKLGAKRFVETGLEDYRPVFDMAKEAGIDLQKYDNKNP